MAILPKLILRFNAITKIPAAFFNRNLQDDLKFIWKGKGPKIGKTILKRTKLEDSHFPISKLSTKNNSNQHSAVLAKGYTY